MQIRVCVRLNAVVAASAIKSTCAPCLAQCTHECKSLVCVLWHKRARHLGQDINLISAGKHWSSKEWLLEGKISSQQRIVYMDVNNMHSMIHDLFSLLTCCSSCDDPKGGYAPCSELHVLY